MEDSNKKGPLSKILGMVWNSSSETHQAEEAAERPPVTTTTTTRGSPSRPNLTTRSTPAPPMVTPGSSPPQKTTNHHSRTSSNLAEEEVAELEDDQDDDDDDDDDYDDDSSTTKGPPYTPPYASVKAIPKEFLYGRHQVPFTLQEDQALIECLWKLTKAGQFRKRAKWQLILEVDAIRSGGILENRTPIQLKDRYRTLARHPKLLLLQSSEASSSKSTSSAAAAVEATKERSRRTPLPRHVKLLLKLNNTVGLPN